MKNFTTIILAFSLLAFGCSSDDDGNKDSATEANEGNNVGDLSRGYLSSSKYQSLIIEVAYEPNTLPTQAVRNELKSFLKSRLNKPSGISFKLTQIPDQNRATVTLARIREIENTYRTVANDANNGLASAFFYFADSDYSENTSGGSVLGIAYASTSMTIFSKTIQDNTGGLGQPSTALVNEAVLKHEFGHILGLVNLGSDLVSAHEDTNHPKHCDEEDCLMYYAVETGDLFSNVLGGVVPRLDAQCIADLRNNGGK